MREFKLTFWVIIFVFISVFIYQNQSFFFQASQNFRINLILAEYKTPEVPSALVFLFCIIIGFFISYVVSIPGRLTSRKKIKILQKAFDSQLKEISSLNKKLNHSNVGDTKPVPENNDNAYSNYR